MGGAGALGSAALSSLSLKRLLSAPSNFQELHSHLLCPPFFLLIHSLSFFPSLRPEHVNKSCLDLDKGPLLSSPTCSTIPTGHAVGLSHEPTEVCWSRRRSRGSSQQTWEPGPASQTSTPEWHALSKGRTAQALASPSVKWG